MCCAQCLPGARCGDRTHIPNPDVWLTSRTKRETTLAGNATNPRVSTTPGGLTPSFPAGQTANRQPCVRPCQPRPPPTPATEAFSQRNPILLAEGAGWPGTVWCGACRNAPTHFYCCVVSSWRPPPCCAVCPAFIVSLPPPFSFSDISWVRPPPMWAPTYAAQGGRRGVGWAGVGWAGVGVGVGARQYGAARGDPPPCACAENLDRSDEERGADAPSSTQQGHSRRGAWVGWGRGRELGGWGGVAG